MGLAVSRRSRRRWKELGASDPSPLQPDWRGAAFPGATPTRAALRPGDRWRDQPGPCTAAASLGSTGLPAPAGTTEAGGQGAAGADSLCGEFLWMRWSARCTRRLICTWKVLGIFAAWKRVAGGSCVSKRDREGALGGTRYSYVSSAIQLSMFFFSIQRYSSLSQLQSPNIRTTKAQSGQPI